MGGARELGGFVGVPERLTVPPHGHELPWLVDEDARPTTTAESPRDRLD
jgi:hypothetical protein